MSMFGALNRFISRLDADPKAQAAQNQGAYGFQVLKNANNETPIEPWFDFIVGINGHNIDNADPNLFATEVRNCAGTNVELGIWSAKGTRIRSLWVPVPSGAPSLGLALQWMPLSTTEDVWHILDVAPNSPADVAGLLPYGDYIIGSPEGLLKGESGFGELVEDYLDQSLRLYVYNQEYNVTRLVTLEPSRSWGGQGALGCTLGYGALHRIPAPLEEPPQAPGETLFEGGSSFEDARFSSDGLDQAPYGTAAQEPSHSQTGTPQYLVPADMNNAPSISPPPGRLPRGGSSSGHGARKKHRHGGGAKMDMNAYLQEGEAKSQELESASNTKGTTAAVPPPPKAGPRTTEPVADADKEEDDSAEG